MQSSMMAILLFVHADVGKLLNSPLGTALRDTPNWVMPELVKVTDEMGLKLSSVKSVDVLVDPPTGGSFDFHSTKPIDQAKFAVWLKQMNMPTQATYDAPGSVRGTVGNAGVESVAAALKRFGLANPTFAVVADLSRMSNADRENLRKMAGQPALFGPLIDADKLRFEANLTEGGAMALTFAAAQPDAAQRPALKASLESLVKVASTLAAVGAAEDPKTTRDKIGPAIYSKLGDTLKTATVTDTPTGPVLKLTLPADFPYDKLVPVLLGEVGPRASAANSVQQNNLKQVGLAMHNCESAYNHFPPAAITDKAGKPLLSWRVAILPYIEQTPLYNQFKLDEPWDSEHNKKLIPLMPKIYADPVEGSAPVDKPQVQVKTRVQVFAGKGTFLEPGKNKKGATLADITDGTSNTIMVALAAEPVEWTKPADMPFDPKGDPRKLLYFVNKVSMVVFGDVSVRGISQDVPAVQWRNAVTRDDGQVQDLDTPEKVTPKK